MLPAYPLWPSILSESTYFLLDNLGTSMTAQPIPVIGSASVENSGTAL